MDINVKNLILLTGPSGAGKTTAALSLLAKRPDIARLITYTTRAKRDGERDGVDYNFVSRENFKKMADAGEFFEWAEVYGSFYGNRLADLEALSKKYKWVLLILDIQGAVKIKEILPSSVGIFLNASLDDLAKRINKRGKMDEVDFRRRMETAKAELAMAERFDHPVSTVTGDIDGMVRAIEVALEGK